MRSKVLCRSSHVAIRVQAIDTIICRVSCPVEEVLSEGIDGVRREGVNVYEVWVKEAPYSIGLGKQYMYCIYSVPRNFGSPPKQADRE